MVLVGERRIMLGFLQIPPPVLAKPQRKRKVGAV